MEPYWSEANGHAPHSVKYESEAAVSSFPYCTESSLNFSTSATAYSEDDAEYATGRRNKTSRQDPLSHRIIEKRRRDRMNSCLADLSRLIPPQYQRKGRGRIEKTEIIEMAIRHLRHLQSECIQKENEYRLGYTDCMKEAAKFLYDSQMQDFCYRLLARLQEHCDELMKNDCYKSRGGCHAPDNVSASSGSPHQVYHPAAPLCHLRDMLASSDIEHSNDHNDVKDLSFRNHLNQLQRNNLSNPPNGGLLDDVQVNGSSSSNNNNNGGSIAASASTLTANNAASSSNNSTPNNNNAAASAAATSAAQQPHQAPVITSTAPASSLHLLHHTDSSNHDYESSREPLLLHTDTSNMHSPPPRDSLLQHHSSSHHHHPHHHQNHHHNNNNNHIAHAHLNHNHHTSDSVLSSTAGGRLRNFSESSHDIDTHNNNYKYKNHIKERFNHELHDEETSSEHCPAPPLLQSEHSHTHSLSEHSKDGTEPEIAPIMAKKRKMAEEAAAVSGAALDDNDARCAPPLTRTPATTASLLSSGNVSGGGLMLAREEKPFSFGDIKTELNASSVSGLLHSASSAVAAHKLHLSLPSSTTSAPPPLARSSFDVPIFALHGQGTYYVPLKVDYNVLVPFLNGIDLLEKNYTSMPVVHPININVNFMSPTPSASLLAAAATAAAIAAGKQQPPALPATAAAAAVSTTTASVAAAAAVAKAKLEAITNGW